MRTLDVIDAELRPEADGENKESERQLRKPGGGLGIWLLVEEDETEGTCT
jgi:hypothetical protein